VSLAPPTSRGTPLLLSGDIGGWAVFEQQVYRVCVCRYGTMNLGTGMPPAII
jgi:hypothetical protein